MKKAFTLLFTLVLVTLISILSIYFFEIKSINSTNTINQYIYLQANNHMDFLEEYIKSKKSLKDINEIEIEDRGFEIKAVIKKEQTKNIVELFVYSKNYNIKLYKELIIE